MIEKIIKVVSSIYKMHIVEEEFEKKKKIRVSKNGGQTGT